jgi:ribonuclease HI
MDKIVMMTTDGGARPKSGNAGWGALIRQNGEFICLRKHYDHASNNATEISAVIAGLTFLSQGMMVWISMDSQYVQKCLNEWMPAWKRNGWKNSKKPGVKQGNKRCSGFSPIRRYTVFHLKRMKISEAGRRCVTQYQYGGIKMR